MKIGISKKFCCGGRKCPTLTRIDEHTYSLTDDNKSKVVLTGEQLKELANYVNTNTTSSSGS